MSFILFAYNWLSQYETYKINILNIKLVIDKKQPLSIIATNYVCMPNE